MKIAVSQRAGVITLELSEFEGTHITAQSLEELVRSALRLTQGLTDEEQYDAFLLNFDLPRDVASRTGYESLLGIGVGSKRTKLTVPLRQALKARGFNTVLEACICPADDLRRTLSVAQMRELAETASRVSQLVLTFDV